MPSGQARHGPSASQSQPKTGPGSVLTAQAPLNRKKAKRRAKEAAKKAAEQTLDHQESASPPVSTPLRNGTNYSVPGAFDQDSLDHQGYHPDDLGPEDTADDYEAANEEYFYSDANGANPNEDPAASSKSRKKKKKRKGGSVSIPNPDDYYDPHNPYSNSHIPPPPPPLPHDHSDVVSHDRIWNTSGSEERENIKEFWLSLEESERRSLVKVEKEAVLKKMKEQQKHSCSCSVCGRKRTAIEEELEVLYDAYYEELEQYANHRVVLEDGTVITGPEAARAYPPVPGRLPPFVGQNGPQSRFQEEPMDDEEDMEGDEFYSDEEDYDDEYDDEPPPQATDFFNFGNSLTVQGGILTVADDLLKNDGKKFIEMMEQLAERRMRREEEAQYAATAGLRMGHTHAHGPPLDDEEGYEDDEYATEEEGYPEDDVGDDELEDDEEADVMTEEQRMEEGRRMFQIFAARMFEQRVLTAYREKVARERQDKLLEELEDEKDRDAEKEAQKARKSAKNKEKKLRQKQQKEEEKAKKEAERKAAADAAKAEEERKAEELRKKRDEQRKKREEEKRKLDEEKAKKDEEKRRKQAEARKLQEEQERKQKEQKEKERLKKEEAKKRELDEKAAKEREARERKEREIAEKKERDAKVKAEKQANQHARKNEQQQQSKASHQGHPVPVAPFLRKQTSNASVPSVANLHTSAQASPHLQIATPVIPKAPSPGRPRQASQQGSSVQGSHASSPKSAQVPSGSSSTSPSTTQQVPVSLPQMPSVKNQMPSQPPQQHEQQQRQQQPPPPPPPLLSHAQGQPLVPPPGMPFPSNPAPGMMPMNGFPSSFGPQTHGQPARYPPGHDPAMFGSHGFGAPYRGFNKPNGMPYPPGINGFRGMTGPPGISPISATSPGPPGGGFAMHSQPFPQAPGQRTQPHSRQPSGTMDKATVDAPINAPAQPIGPPAPIKRPSSPEDKKGGDQVDDLNKQLGSSALLDDDAPVESMPRDIQGGPTPFNSNPLFQEPFRSGPSSRATFSSPAIGGGPFHAAYSGPGAAAAASWTAAPGQHFGGAGSGGMFAPSRHQPRAVWLRTMAIEACNRLSKSPHLQAAQQGGFHAVDAIANEVNAMRPQNEPPIPKQELLDICDTEGNQKNGGGTFVRNQDQAGGIWIKFERDVDMPPSNRHSIDAIGSPLVGHATPSFGGGGGGGAGAPGFGPPRFAAPGSGVSGF